MIFEVNSKYGVKNTKYLEPNWAKTINLVQIWEQVVTYTTNVTINNMNNFPVQKK
jgi:hypothetical protein